LKGAAAKAGVDLAAVIIQSERDIRQKKGGFGQTKIGLSIESPISWERSVLKDDLDLMCSISTI